MIFASYEVERVEFCKGEKIIHLRRYPSPIGKLFGRRERIESYIGECTVWRTYPGFRRAGTVMESMLSDFDAEIEFARPDRSPEGATHP